MCLVGINETRHPDVLLLQELWQAGAVAPASGGGQVQVQARHQQRPR
jgi:hypothetical protein